MFGNHFQSAKLCVCVRGPLQGFRYLYLTHFRAWKAKACRHMRRLVRTLSTPFYRVWMSRREDPSGIFNMLFIETAIDCFFFSSFRPVEIYLYFVKFTPANSGKGLCSKYLVSKNVQNMKPLQKCAKYETCAICSGFIFCTFFETTLSFFLISR